MIGTFITSPLGLVIVLALLVLALWIVGLRDRRELERLRRVRARELRRSPAPRTLAGHVFHQAGLPGREDCPVCKGEGGRLELRWFPVGWSREVELEALLGFSLPQGTQLPLFVVCIPCEDARTEEWRRGLMEEVRRLQQGEAALNPPPAAASFEEAGT